MQYHNNVPQGYGYPQQQMQPALPYSAQQPNPMAIKMVDVNNPPFVPQLQVEDFLQPWVRFAAGLTASVIVAQGNKQPANAFRIFMYNECSANNFMNPSFEGVVANIMNLVAFKVMLERAYTPDGAGIQRALQEHVELVCELVAVNNVRVHPGLQAFLPQDMAEKANQILGLYDNIKVMIGQLHQWRASQGMGGQQQMQQVPQFQQVHTNPGMVVGGFNNNAGNRFQGSYNPQGQVATPYGQYQQPMQQQNFGLTGGTNQTGLFREQTMPTPNQAADAVSDIFRDRWGGGTNSKVIEEYAPESFTPVVAESIAMAPPTVFEMEQTYGAKVEELPFTTDPVAQQVETTPVVETKSSDGSYTSWHGVEILGGTDYDLSQHPLEIDTDEKLVLIVDAQRERGDRSVWAPSEKYRMVPSWNPLTERCYFMVYASGVVAPRIIKMEGKMPFDYNLHDARLTVLPKEFKFDESRTNAAMVENTTKVEYAVYNSTEEETEVPDEFEPIVDAGMTIVNNVDTAWDTHLVMKTDLENKLDKKVHVYTTQMYSVRGFVSEGGSIADFINEMREAKTYKEINNVLATGLGLGRGYWSALEVKLTKAINDIVRRGLCIPGLSVTSFHEDIDELTKIIGEKYGQLTLEAFNRGAETIVRRVIPERDPEAAEIINSELRRLIPDTTSEILYLVDRVNLTSINCMSEELLIKLPASGVGVNVSQRENGLLRSLVRRILSQGQNARNLIRTADGAVLEVNGNLFSTGKLAVEDVTIALN